MNEWEAKYKALAAGIDDEQLVVNAEKLVEAASRQSVASAVTFERVVYAMLQAVYALRELPQDRN